MSRITPSVLNKLCNPLPLLLPLCLQSLSARIVLKLSRKLLELFLQPLLGEKKLGVFQALSSSILSTSDLTFPLMIKGRNGLSLFYRLHFVPALPPRRLLFHCTCSTLRICVKTDTLNSKADLNVIFCMTIIQFFWYFNLIYFQMSFLGGFPISSSYHCWHFWVKQGIALCILWD